MREDDSYRNAAQNHEHIADVEEERKEDEEEEKKIHQISATSLSTGMRSKIN